MWKNQNLSNGTAQKIYIDITKWFRFGCIDCHKNGRDLYTCMFCKIYLIENQLWQEIWIVLYKKHTQWIMLYVNIIGYEYFIVQLVNQEHQQKVLI